MKKRIVAFSISILIFSVSFAFIGSTRNNESVSNISYGYVDSQGASDNIVDDFVNDRIDSASDMNELIGDITDIGGDIIGNIAGDVGLGDIINGNGLGGLIEGAGDIIGGLTGGGGTGGIGSWGQPETYAPQNTTGEYIAIIPALTDYYVESTADPSVSASATDSENVGETVDFGAPANPYTKPVGELRGGDTGDGVKWIQWMFIYTRYGLKDNGITGVFDEDTMAVVKKLQKESGMIVDGIVDEEVIQKIQELYDNSFYNGAVVSSPIATTTSPVFVADVDEGDDSLFVIIALIAAVWILAIILIIILRVTKSKKKLKAKTESEPENKRSEATDSADTTDGTDN